MGVLIVGGQEYRDCFHCGLMYNYGGPLRVSHEIGTCVNVWGPKDAREKARDKRNGALEEAAARAASRQQVGSGGSDKDAPSPRIVAPSGTFIRTGEVQKGGA